MKIQDYRIGNLLDYNGKVVKITTLGIDYGGNETIIASNKSFLWHVSKLDGIKPIKLTEKIISEICGKLNELSGDYRINVTDDFSMSFAMDNDMIYIGDDIEIRVSETPLHKLQNIYFEFSGKELTFENEI